LREPDSFAYGAERVGVVRDGVIYALRGDGTLIDLTAEPDILAIAHTAGLVNPAETIPGADAVPWAWASHPVTPNSPTSCTLCGSSSSSTTGTGRIRASRTTARSGHCPSRWQPLTKSPAFEFGDATDSVACSMSYQHAA
jgi:hypothetical protein